MKLTPAGVLVLVAFSVPVAIELPTLFGLVGIDLPFAAVGVFEVVLLVLIGIAYATGSGESTAAKH